MGYNLYISRKENSFDDAGEKISEAAWNSYVKLNDDLYVDHQNVQYIRSHRLEGHWLYWNDGCLDCENPSEPFVELMTNIAEDLDAKVQGDDGEIYSKEPYGFKVVDGESPPRVVEYHRGEAGGSQGYTEVVVSSHAPDRLEKHREKVAKIWFWHRLKKISVAAIVLLLAILALLLFVGG